MDIPDFIIAFILYFIVLPSGILTNLKLYRNVRREEHRENGKVVQSIIKHYSIVNCIIWPLLCIVIGITYILDKVFEKAPEWTIRYLVLGLRFSYGLAHDYIGFNSLIIAITRYAFLFYETKVEKVGIKRLRKFFMAISFIVPICNSILFEFTHPTEKAWIHYMPKKMVESNDELINVTYDPIARERMIHSYNSPVYSFINRISSASVTQTLIIINYILVVIIYSNVIEGFLYARAITMYLR